MLAVVTGGSRGLGLQNAKDLRALGYDVVLVASNEELLTRVAQEIGAHYRVVDLSDLDKTRQIFSEIVQSYGAPDVLLLAHGVMSEKMSKTLRSTTEEWRRVMAINLDSTFVIVNTVVPAMAERRSGRVIVYSACLGRMSGPGNAGGLAPYRISKAGVNALVRNLAHETGLGARGILVDALCPNHTRTDMGGPDAPRSVEEGAATALWLATRSFTPGIDTTGVLWEDQQVIDW